MRKKVILVCTKCLNRNYTTSKKVENEANRLILNKFCKHCNEYTEHKESK